MVTPLLALGFALGIRHALDPDHVVAVTTIVSRQRKVRTAALIGAAWGAGHTLTILIVGGAIIIFNVALPPRLGLGLEAAVAVMLILLGAKKLVTKRSHCTTCNGSGALLDTTEKPSFCDVCLGSGRELITSHSHDNDTILKSLTIGVIHGLAGSAAAALLVLAAIKEPISALTYLLVFGIGTVAGMMLITSAIAVPMLCTRSSYRVTLLLDVLTSVVSVFFGIALLYGMVTVGGLFSHAVVWSPR